MFLGPINLCLNPSQPLAMNNCDIIVGSYGPFADAERAFLWEKSRGFRDLNTYITSDSGWKLSLRPASMIAGVLEGALLQIAPILHPFCLLQHFNTHRGAPSDPASRAKAGPVPAPRRVSRERKCHSGLQFYSMTASVGRRRSRYIISD